MMPVSWPFESLLGSVLWTKWLSSFISYDRKHERVFKDFSDDDMQESEYAKTCYSILGWVAFINQSDS